MTTRSLEANFVISSSTSTTCYMNLEPGLFIIAPWCGLIRVTVNWIVAELTRLPIQPEPQSDIMVTILFSGSSPGQCSGMPGPAAAYDSTVEQSLVNDSSDKYCIHLLRKHVRTDLLLYDRWQASAQACTCC